MLCQVCKLQKATIHYTEVADDRVTDIHVCEKCHADHEANAQQAFILSAPPSAPELDKDLLDEDGPVLTCPDCGLTSRDAEKNSWRLGCTTCYKTFEELLKQILEKMQSQLQHVGKFPSMLGEDFQRKQDLIRLRTELEAAVRSENYEEAARLRDLISELEVQSHVSEEEHKDAEKKV